METFLLLLLVFVVPGLVAHIITYLIDTAKGETSVAQKYKNQKIYDSIDSKLKNKEPLTAEEKQKISKDILLYDLICDIENRNLDVKEEYPNSGEISSSINKEIDDRLSKIMWFYSNNEFFNYGVVRGFKQRSNLRSEQLLVLQHLLFRIGTEKGYNRHLAKLKYHIQKNKNMVFL